MQLRDYVRFNSDFRDSVNLYLDLNKVDKIKSYIPTKSSVDILEQYLDAVLDNKQHSTLLIGPYGKGKSHLLLMLLAALTLKNNASNDALMDELCDKIKRVSGEVQKKVSKAYKQGKYLPVLIMSTQGDLNQAFLVGLNEALKREKLTGITPDTFYTYAVSTINRWKKAYPDTYANFSEMLKEYKYTVTSITSALKNCDETALNIFKIIYPKLTSGSEFNPLVGSEVLPMYKNIADKLVEEYGYSGIYIVFDEFSKYIEGQDKKIAGYAYEAGKGVIIVVNKWDLVEKDDKTTLRFTEDIYDELGFLQFAPILFASALTKQRIHRLADMLKFVSEQQYRRVSTGTLNQLLQDAQTVNPVPSRNGRIPKIYYMTQASVKPPTFILFVNEPELIHFSYMRFLENRLRESFGFEGTPIRLVLRGKKRDDED